MKFSDLDKNLLTEAPAADGGDKEGKMARMGTKLKKKLGPTKDMRNRAEGKDEIQQEALNIKKAFQKWAGRQGVPNTAKSLIAFFQNNNYNEEYAAKVPEIAVKLQFEPEGFDRVAGEPGNEPTGDGKPDATGDEVDGDNLELVPDEDSKEAGGEQSEEEVRAAYAKQGEELEAKRKASPDGELQDESVEEDSDDSEPKVDMSASIYEAKLAYLLMEDTKLKDNQLDTLLVRLLQAVGVKSMPQQEPQQQEPQQDQEQEKEPSKYRKFMNKANKVAFGDMVGGGEEGDDSGSSGGSEIDSLTGREKGLLKNILDKVIAGKSLESDEIKAAKKIQREL